MVNHNAGVTRSGNWLGADSGRVDGAPSKTTRDVSADGRSDSETACQVTATGQRAGIQSGNGGVDGGSGWVSRGREGEGRRERE